MVMTPNRIVPNIQAGGGNATSEIPALNFYASQEIQDHIKLIYNALCGSESLLSREHVEAFFSAVQKQPVTLPDKQHYKFEEFFEVVWYMGGFQVLAEPSPLDLSKPISHYFISSSHNTYLSGNQLSSKSSVDAYKNVLIRGCRCIEIDVWNGELPPSGAAGRRPHFPPHLTSSSFSQAASAVTAAVEHGKQVGKSIIDDGKHFIGDKLGRYHSRVPSINADDAPASDSEKTSAVDSTAPADAIDCLPSNHTSRHSSSSSTRTEPRVLHGWTLTSEVGFREVCATIRETAFLTTTLPIIVSLEVHADLDQQEVMVQIMKEEWNGLLVDEPCDSCNPAERLPKLHELLNKILVKVKKATPSTPTNILSKQELTPSSTPKTSSSSLVPWKSPDPGEFSGSEDERGNKSKRKKVKICESLSRLGIYTHSAHFTSFSQEEALRPPHIFSVSENQIQELQSTNPAEMFAHNRDYLMRAYPSGRRIDSSNPDPSIFWRKGVQMVALNWQSWDEGTMLNEAMFAGEKGWVLKPAAYRSFEDGADVVPVNRVTLDFKITIFAGQHIPLPAGYGREQAFNPYVKCELHVDKPDGQLVESSSGLKDGKYKRSTKPLQGTHPDFGIEGAVLSFLGVPNVIEELCFVRLKVEDYKYTVDTLAAWACIRLDRIQQGYRFVRLLDAKGQTTDGLLLVKIEKTIL